MSKSKLAAAMAATKTILGAAAVQPATVLMPKAIAELHVAPDVVIPDGTVITDEIAEAAELDAETLAALEAAGHVTFIQVYMQAPVADA